MAETLGFCRYAQAKSTNRSDKLAHCVNFPIPSRSRFSSASQMVNCLFWRGARNTMKANFPRRCLRLHRRYGFYSGMARGFFSNASQNLTGWLAVVVIALAGCGDRDRNYLIFGWGEIAVRLSLFRTLPPLTWGFGIFLETLVIAGSVTPLLLIIFRWKPVSLTVGFSGGLTWALAIGRDWF